jgi:hypothetical protein
MMETDFDFAACFRYAKRSFRERLHKKILNLENSSPALNGTVHKTTVVVTAVGLLIELNFRSFVRENREKYVAPPGNVTEYRDLCNPHTQPAFFTDLTFLLLFNPANTRLFRHSPLNCRFEEVGFSSQTASRLNRSISSIVRCRDRWSLGYPHQSDRDLEQLEQARETTVFD